MPKLASFAKGQRLCVGVQSVAQTLPFTLSTIFCHLPCSALHFAAAMGNVKITQMLCQSGADVNLNDKDGAYL